MKTTFAVIISILTASISAAPLEARQSNDVTVALSNDQSGAYAGVKFPADGTDKSIKALYGGTSVGASGSVLASSAQLAAFPQTIHCVIKNNGAVIATLDAQHTFADLDGNPAAATPVNLDHGIVNCRA
ncbi:hypothetical protein BDV32DRAFT_151192 [Aspergillus pseudonomiae]|uniref:Uncharacterized protein n=1 Tax=Aspergillus pseudonomiae TaxID=1506151 RepID=A0A5N7D803_9EURO|nr:uncharacterized protein BDV37DRAFT_284689 [Aspergillus pseudonomiae]KAB8258562.1 hypothetical protein BDV32DRAFT_151192 [Aspergillus pseudonomiae]KAE8402556.1 hypothetical protein BDV37DRAFT_284689 [Aspergillus pseudonomiae]